MTNEEAKEYAKEMTYRDAINNLMKARSIPYRKATFIKVNELLNALEQKPCNELPTVAIPQNNNGCENCRWQSRSESEMPCKQCMHNYTDKWEMKKLTDTITMTREETKWIHTQATAVTNNGIQMIGLACNKCKKVTFIPTSMKTPSCCPWCETMAEQEPKTGHWIEGKYSADDIRYNDSSYKCNKCGKVVDFKENFCPDCGTRMVEPQESEDKG